MSKLPKIPVENPEAMLHGLILTAETDKEFARVLCERVARFARSYPELSWLTRELAHRPRSGLNWEGAVRPKSPEPPGNLPFWELEGQRLHLMCKYAEFMKETDHDSGAAIDRLCEHYAESFDRPITSEHMEQRLSDAIRVGRLDDLPPKVREVITTRKSRHKGHG